jgi:hypothetical protein
MKVSFVAQSVIGSSDGRQSLKMKRNLRRGPMAVLLQKTSILIFVKSVSALANGSVSTKLSRPIT